MGKIYAAQVPWDKQSSPLDVYEDIDENVYLHGNPHFNSHTHGMGAIFARFEHPDKICRALSILKKTPYTYGTLQGWTQSEWQGIYYPENYGAEYVNTFEIEYFNTGTEWNLFWNESDALAAIDMDICLCDERIYCVTTPAEKGIAEAMGVHPDEVVLYEFAGYSHKATYNRKEGL